MTLKRGVEVVRNLGIFIISLIQKYNISRFVIAYMCMCIFLMNATACIDDIQIDTVKTQNTVIREIRLYPAEGPMPRASEAPFAVQSQSMQEDVRSAVPRTDHQEEDALTFRRQSPERRCTWTSSRGSLLKNLIVAHPV